MIELFGVSKIYGEKTAAVKALDNVNLAIGKGEFVAVMGPSGSGKSTMLNIIGCLDRPSKGRYLIDGADTGKLGVFDKARIRSSDVGFVFQSFNLLTDKCAIENVMLPLRYTKLRKKEWEKAAEKALSMVGMGEYAWRYPDQLSGGQQQRVAIARALVNDPGIILADEPTGNLDRATGMEIMELLYKLCKEQGKIIIAVTHDVKVAGFADRIIQLVDGRVTEDNKISDCSFKLINPFEGERNDIL